MMDDSWICWLPARAQAALVRARQLSVTELVSLHPDRIGAVNPAVNAIVTLDPDRALREAAAADEAVARGEPLGPLHGGSGGLRGHSRHRGNAHDVRVAAVCQPRPRC